jgi:hypothetical protein
MPEKLCHPLKTKELKEILLCKDCINCKITNGNIKCKNGKFTNKSNNDIMFYTPILFDCEDGYEKVD